MAQPKDHEAKQERAKLLAHAILLLDSGVSRQAVSRSTGIARTTLFNAHKRSTSAKTDTAKAELDALVIGHAYTIAQLAGEQIAQDIADGRLSPAQRLNAYGVAVDKIAAYRRWNRPEDVASDSFLAHLGSALSRVRSVTVQLADPVDLARNVTPQAPSDSPDAPETDEP